MTYDQLFSRYSYRVANRKMTWLEAQRRVMEDLGAEYEFRTEFVSADCGCGCREACDYYGKRPVLVLEYTVDGVTDTVVSHWTDYVNPAKL